MAKKGFLPLVGTDIYIANDTTNNSFGFIRDRNNIGVVLIQNGCYIFSLQPAISSVKPIPEGTLVTVVNNKNGDPVTDTASIFISPDPFGDSTADNIVPLRRGETVSFIYTTSNKWLPFGYATPIS